MLVATIFAAAPSASVQPLTGELGSPKKVPPPRDVIRFGIGSNTFTAKLNKQALKVIALQPTPEQIIPS